MAIAHIKRLQYKLVIDKWHNSGNGALQIIGLDRGGSAWGTAGNNYGELAIPTDNNYRYSFSQVAQGHKFSQILSISDVTLGLKSNGTLWWWGYDEYGTGGDNTVGNAYSSPVVAATGHSFTQIAGAGTYVFGIKSNKSLWSWGYNGDGTLGHGTQDDTSSPVQVIGGFSVNNVVCTENGTAGFLDTNGNAWCMGYNDFGECGDLTNDPQSSPVSVVGGHVFTKLTAGSLHIAGLKANGSIWVWGRNNYGTLGDETNDPSSSPVSVIGGFTCTDIFGGESMFLAIVDDGSGIAWGLNTYGNLGDETTDDASSPVVISTDGTAWKSIGLEYNNGNVLAIDENDELWGWAYGPEFTSSIAGAASYPIYLTANNMPIRNRIYYSPKLNHLAHKPCPFIPVVAGLDTNHALKMGIVGNFDWMHLRDGEEFSYFNKYICSANDATSWTMITNSNYAMAGLKPDGSVWTWGYDLSNSGVFGNLTTDDTPSASQVVGGHSFIDICGGSERFFGLKSNGQVWGWGNNTDGYLGNNAIVNRSSPVSVVGGHSFIDIISGTTFTIALKADGSAWTWGGNDLGELGDLTTDAKSSPVPVVGGFSFTKIAAGGRTGYGITSTGQIWSWGSNGYWQLGNGVSSSILHQSSPVSVIGGFSFVNVFAGSTFTMAQNNNGKLWAWGYNALGQVGDNTLTNRSSPVSVVGNISFKEVNARYWSAVAIDSNDDVWMWGDSQGAPVTHENPPDYISSPIKITGFFWTNSLISRKGLSP